MGILLRFLVRNESRAETTRQQYINERSSTSLNCLRSVNFCQLFHFDLHVSLYFFLFFSVILSKRWLKVTATAIFSFSIVISFNVARLNVFLNI